MRQHRSKSLPRLNSQCIFTCSHILPNKISLQHSLLSPSLNVGVRKRIQDTIINITSASNYSTLYQLWTSSIIRISEILEKFRYVITKHVINGLYQFWLQLFKLINVITTQNFPEVFDVGKIPSWQMVFLLNLY